MGQSSGTFTPFLVPDERKVQRDIFPLPSFGHQSELSSGNHSRKAQQRAHRRSHVSAMVEDCIAGLNALYSGGPVTAPERGKALSEAQVAVHGHLLNSVLKLGPPGPLQQLRAFDGYGEDQIPSTIRSYSPELLSLPSSGNRAVPLDELLGSSGCDIVGEFQRSRVLRKDEARKNLAGCGVRHAYTDPRLRHPATYRAFVKRLFDAGLVEMSTERPTEVVEAFFVGKKDGRLRMVIDCRRSNCWFESPDPVTLCSAEALSRVELEPNTQLQFSTADLKDAFYHFSLPGPLRTFFGMRSVLAGDIGLTSLNGSPLDFRTRIYPRLCVLPMGWSHALWWCQMIHQKIVGDAGATRETCLEDRTSCPRGGLMHIEYVDNFIVLGSCKSEVDALASHGVKALREKGLVVHEEESSADEIKVLGWQFSGTELRPLPHRVWRLRLAMQKILTTGRISGKQLEKVVGHASFIMLGRREALAIFGETYTYIQRRYHYPHRIWKSVRRELQIFNGICPLIWRDLAQPWSTEVAAIDASEWGLGCTSAEFSIEEVKQLGKHSERWRFDTDEYAKPRASTFGAEIAKGDVDSFNIFSASTDSPPGHLPPIQVVDGKPLSEKFEPLSFGVLDKAWRVTGRGRWKRKEPIPVLEARASLYGIKHTLRNTSNFKKRHVILSDSITAVAALDKGRGRSFKMRRVTQEVAALCLSTHTSFHFRWLPSEWNPADGPSRGSKFASRPQPVHCDGYSPTCCGGTPMCQAKGVEKEATSSASCQNSPRQTERVEGGASQTTAGGGGFTRSSFSGEVRQEEVPRLYHESGKINWNDPSQPAHGRTGGSSSMHDVGSVVSGGRRYQSGSIHVSSGPFSSSPSSIPKADQPAYLETKPSGMEEAGPPTSKASLAVGCSLQDGHRDEAAQHDRAGPHAASGVRC